MSTHAWIQAVFRYCLGLHFQKVDPQTEEANQILLLQQQLFWNLLTRFASVRFISLLGFALELGVDLTSDGVSAERASEEENVRLWPVIKGCKIKVLAHLWIVAPVNRVVNPPTALLHAEAAPLGLRQELPLGDALCDLAREDHVPARG